MVTGPEDFGASEVVAGTVDDWPAEGVTVDV